MSEPSRAAPEQPPLGAVLLRPGDLGPGWRESVTGPETPPWPWLQVDCPAYRSDDYPAQGHRRAAVQRRYQNDASAVVALHVVEAYEPGWAVRSLDDARRVLHTCSEYAAWGGRISFAVVESDFSADEALLVRGRIDRPGSPATVAYFVSVRRGEVVSTLNLPDPGDEDAVRAAAKKLAGPDV